MFNEQESGRYLFDAYIDVDLAGDFACAIVKLIGGREAALREELYQAKEARDREMLAGVRLQRELVAAEQQNEKLVGLLKEMRSNQHTFISFYRGALDAAIKPTESGASDKCTCIRQPQEPNCTDCPRRKSGASA